jgi:cytosine/adenosine deaminase-related metal-dependent hydrolase
VGRRADLVVVDAPSVQEAYRTQPPRVAVIHDGRLVAERAGVSEAEVHPDSEIFDVKCVELAVT